MLQSELGDGGLQTGWRKQPGDDQAGCATTATQLSNEEDNATCQRE